MRRIDQHIRAFLLFLTLSLVSEAALAQYADQLGRLFSTQRERMELDEIRRIFLQDVAPGEELELPPGAEIMVTPPPPDDLYLMLEGTVRRADGSYTLWLNKEPIDQQQLPSNIRLARLGDLIVLWVNYLGNRYIVRPGQVLHFATEAVYEPYLLPEELKALMRPPAAPGTTDPLPSSVLPGGEAIGGLLETISTITTTLNTIQEITQ
jgi:hypothetical protein